jgi:hypothetical protein
LLISTRYRGRSALLPSPYFVRLHDPQSFVSLLLVGTYYVSARPPGGNVHVVPFARRDDESR